MDNYRELAEHLKNITSGTAKIAIYQGIVRRVEGYLCDVEIGNITIPDVRLRASSVEVDGDYLATPAIGSAVIVGSLSGDLSELVVLAIDKVESISINGGKLGGLINIEELTAKLNELVEKFNTHIHPTPKGMSSKPVMPLRTFNARDYEDETIKH